MITEETIRSSIDDYLRPLIDNYIKRLIHHTQPKILRDVIWGFNSYSPYELNLIDSPPFQRLRNILQTSLALLTYPCAVHSRFEHSLGVAAVASRMLNAIEERSREQLNPHLRIEARIAALLHDLAHGPYSHGSEKFYEGLTDSDGELIFDALKRQNDIFVEASASEILTYLLITTQSFKDLWSAICGLYSGREPDLRDVNLERAASMILGTDSMVGEDARFYRQVVNGPFDSDKLDYLPRDGYFTGLEIVVDIERLLHTVTVVTSGGITDIGVVASGASVLEQVIFSKTQLYNSMYHHHKVRAAHQSLLKLLRLMSVRKYKPAGRSLEDPISFLILDDYDLLRSSHGDPEIDSVVQNIKMRILPRRALVISYPCFSRDDDESRENFFQRLEESDFRRIEKQVEEELGLPEGSVIFDIPEQPRLFGQAQAAVEIAEGDILLLQDLYPAGAWAKAHAGYRRMAYVFTTVSDRRAVGQAVIEALKGEKYPVKLNGNSLKLAKP